MAQLGAALDAARRLATYGTVPGRLLDSAHRWLIVDGRGRAPSGEWWTHVLSLVRVCAYTCVDGAAPAKAVLQPWLTGQQDGATFRAYAPSYDPPPTGAPPGPPGEEPGPPG